MKCQNLFSRKNKKNILKCRLLKILPRVLSVRYSISQQNFLTGNSENKIEKKVPFMVVIYVHNCNFHGVFSAQVDIYMPKKSQN